MLKNTDVRGCTDVATWPLLQMDASSEILMGNFHCYCVLIFSCHRAGMRSKCRIIS